MRNKTVHYCWFGGNPMPERLLSCMESWKRYCPDYNLVRWDESNFDVNCCAYVKEAYEAKKWAFVSDYCRFYVLFRHGGIYLDTDVELLRPLDDLPDTFVGFENHRECASGLIRGAAPGDAVCRRMLDSYEKDRFLLPGGRLNTKTVCQRETAILEELGLRRNGREQVVAGTHIYPREYFCPMDYYTRELRITEHTYSIHHYDASWYSQEDKLAEGLRKKYRWVLPARWAIRAARLEAIIKSRGLTAAVKETVGFITRK